MGSGAHLLVVGSEPPYEQGLREVVCYQRGVRLRGDGPDHGEALSSCLGFIKQFLEELFSETELPAYKILGKVGGHEKRVGALTSDPLCSERARTRLPVVT